MATFAPRFTAMFTIHGTRVLETVDQVVTAAHLVFRCDSVSWSLDVTTMFARFLS